jgi:hypothetical protein
LAIELLSTKKLTFAGSDGSGGLGYDQGLSRNAWRHSAANAAQAVVLTVFGVLVGPSLLAEIARRLDNTAQ